MEGYQALKMLHDVRWNMLQVELSNHHWYNQELLSENRFSHSWRDEMGWFREGRSTWSERQFCGLFQRLSATKKKKPGLFFSSTKKSSRRRSGRGAGKSVAERACEFSLCKAWQIVQAVGIWHTFCFLQVEVRPKTHKWKKNLCARHCHHLPHTDRDVFISCWGWGRGVASVECASIPTVHSWRNREKV